nr:serine protease persephone-like [Aedes albopictus]XP_029733232.1 serine protease persephone-like [Aedes albopictus]XP_029733233.1 serine protease persephone-like [Aedes albopictus]XP_029733234.1 serine protease persephone-like [Aedes albopictus]XP_029733235.1 serine protease persephone-like [Aedes albopictus]XP_029733236.1 serine protease persephone-like [Aedes albopictus]XP_029733237.1 serine protease persephone-like [Aedes albopictus]
MYRPVRSIVVAVCGLFAFSGGGGGGGGAFEVSRTLAEDPSEKGDNCLDLNGSLGTCTLPNECPWFVQNVIRVKRISYVDVPKCGFTRDDELICCPKEDDLSRLGSNGDQPQRKAAQACRNFQRGISYIAQHIIEGVEADDGEVPFIAALGYSTSEAGRKYAWGCGSSWIAKKFLLTAAHCVRANQRPIVARMGTLNLEANDDRHVQDSELKKFYPHPSYTSKSKYHDIALIELVTAFTFDQNVNMICLHTDTQDMIPTHVLKASGWGLTDTDKSRSDILLRVDLSTQPLAQCAQQYQSQVGDANGRLASGVIEQQYCAIGKRHASGKRGDSCVGDSGGPLYYADNRADRFFLVGITSFGLGCGDSASIYTRVASYLDWIEPIVWPDEASLQQ